jgi:archaellum component FlaF (FlaF/FlaG flagellin family)
VCGGTEATGMSIYEAVGMAWVIFSSALATVGILYLAFIGLRVTLDRAQEAKETDVPVEVKEMFKIAR